MTAPPGKRAVFRWGLRGLQPRRLNGLADQKRERHAAS